MFYSVTATTTLIRSSRKLLLNLQTDKIHSSGSWSDSNKCFLPLWHKKETSAILQSLEKHVLVSCVSLETFLIDRFTCACVETKDMFLLLLALN